VKTRLVNEVSSWVGAVNQETIISFVRDEDQLSIYLIELGIRLVEEAEVGARLEFLEREGMLHSNLSGMAWRMFR
jgi:hypothetical protein